MITAGRIAEALPFTAGWDAAARDRLVEGINMLGTIPIGQSNADDLVGLILWRSEGSDLVCRWARKSILLDNAERFELDPGSVAALLEGKPRGTVDVYAQISRYEFVFCMPIRIVSVDPTARTVN